MIDLSDAARWREVWDACRSAGVVRSGGAAYEVRYVGTSPLGYLRQVRWAVLRPVGGGEAVEVSCEAEVLA